MGEDRQLLTGCSEEVPHCGLYDHRLRVALQFQAAEDNYNTLSERVAELAEL